MTRSDDFFCDSTSFVFFDCSCANGSSISFACSGVVSSSCSMSSGTSSLIDGVVFTSSTAGDGAVATPLALAVLANTLKGLLSLRLVLLMSTFVVYL